MIWDPDKRDDSSMSPLVSHLVSELASACGSGLSLDRDDLRELANAVECFLVENSGCDRISSEDLALLASQALFSVGEGHAARHYVLRGTGLVKPSEWEFTGGNEVWVLDLKQMTFHEDAPLEILFFAGLLAVLDAVAEVWDDSQGAGALGLRHVCSAGALLLGGSAKKHILQDFNEEVKLTCQTKLYQIAERRGWQDTPQVTIMDM